MGKHKVTRPAVFLDRDGTLILDRDDIITPSMVQILKTVPEGLRLMRESGFLLIVISNQPVVGKKLITQAGVRKLNGLLNARLAEQGASLAAIYFCPHRAWDGCPCRKPKLALVRAAVKKYDIDVRRSFFVGDDMRDVETGRRARMKTILVKTGKAGKDKRFFDVAPDFVAKDMLAAAKIIKKISL